MAPEEDQQVPHEWVGKKIVANGRIFYDECDICGWPKPDHPRVQIGSTEQVQP